MYQAIYNSLPFNGEGGLGQLILMKSGNHSLEEIIEFEDGDFTRFNAIILAALQLNPQQRATFWVKLWIARNPSSHQNQYQIHLYSLMIQKAFQ